MPKPLNVTSQSLAKIPQTMFHKEVAIKCAIAYELEQYIMYKIVVIELLICVSSI